MSAAALWAVRRPPSYLLPPCRPCAGRPCWGHHFLGRRSHAQLETRGTVESNIRTDPSHLTPLSLLLIHTLPPILHELSISSSYLSSLPFTPSGALAHRISHDYCASAHLCAHSPSSIFTETHCTQCFSERKSEIACWMISD